jgi:hypothetical protein
MKRNVYETVNRNLKKFLFAIFGFLILASANIKAADVELVEAYSTHLICKVVGYDNACVSYHVDKLYYRIQGYGGWVEVENGCNGANFEINLRNRTPSTSVTIEFQIRRMAGYWYWGSWVCNCDYSEYPIHTWSVPAYNPVSNVQATDGTYANQVKVTWSINEIFNPVTYSYHVYADDVLVGSSIPGGTSTFYHTGLQPGTVKEYKVIGYVYGWQPAPATNSGSTFNLNLQATSNQTSSVVLSWNSHGNTNQSAGFYLDWFNPVSNAWDPLYDRNDNVYTSYTDNGGVHNLIPGYTYNYRMRVKPVATSDVTGTTSGKVMPNGKISGYVRTPIPNQVGVPSVTVSAVLVGEPLPTDATTTYTATTNADGYYEINNIYYYETADFIVTPDFDGRTFDPENQTKTLDLSNPTTTANFTDMSSFTVSGTILQGSCPIAGVDIMLDNDSTYVTTDIDGNYTITISNGGTYIIKPILENHLFDPIDQEIDVTVNLTDIDFQDTTTYLVEGYLAASCNSYIGQGDIRFYSTDPSYCFDQTVSTELGTGYYSVRLPARDLFVSMTDFASVDEGILTSLDVLAYFSIPRSLDITYYNEDNFHGDSTSYDLIYRLPPSLMMTGLSYAQTCSGETVPLVRQFEPSIIQFVANEDFNGNICPAGDGFIVIRENVSSVGMDENIDTVYYQQGETINYELIPGTPNLIEAQGFKKFFEATLVRDNQTDVIYTEVIVLGNNPRNLNFTTVTPQVPFHILHNPPGDASYAFLQEDQSVSTSFTQSFLQEGTVDTYIRAQLGAAFSVEVGFIAGVSTEVSAQNDLTLSLGLGSGGLTEWASVITTTTSEMYQTSGNVDITGGDGDVYIGAALNMIYGVTDVLTYDFTNCEFEQSATIVMQPNGIESTFMYTESHITNVIIPELQSITNYYTTINEVDSAAYFANQLNVWEQVVEENHDNIENGEDVETISFSGGVGYSNSLSTARTSSKTFDWNIYVDYGVALDVGMSVAGAGIYGGVAVRGRSTWGKVTSDETTSTTTVGYYLGDDDVNDDYLVQVVEDKVYGVPAFKLISGQTSCPFEEGTVPREGVQLTSNTTYQSVEESEQAVYILHLANTSETDEEMTYDLIFDHTTNPGGASITIGGSPIVGNIPYPYTIPAWGSVDVTIVVSRGPIEYDYNGLKFILKSQCDDEISDEEYLNAHFYKEYDLTVAISGSGNTNLSPGIYEYQEGTTVNLYATANAGYVFQKWIVGATEYTTQAIPVVLNANTTATAYFIESVEPQFTVNISVIGNGITLPPAGNHIHNEGTVIELSATPNIYNAFLMWVINGEEVFEPITEITITENTTAVAHFVETHQLTMSVSGEGTTTPATGINVINHGQSLYLYASPAMGYAFEKWIIADEEFFTQSVEIEVNEDMIATAYFVPTTEEQHYLNISTDGVGGQTIPPEGEHLFIDGSLIELTAIPDENYVFDKWIINSMETSNNPINLTITGEFTSVAYFTEIPSVVPGAAIKNLCNIFPNPSDGNAEVTSNEIMNEITVFDITGKVSFQIKDVNSKNYALFLNEYKPGVYFVNILTKSGSSTLKMQILR